MRINLTTPMSDDKERQRRNATVLDAIEQYTEERMNDEYGRIHTDGSRSGGQPVVATQKAHTMLLEVLAEWGIAVRNATAQQLAVATTEALCRAIDQLEDLRQPTQNDALREENERLLAAVEQIAFSGADGPYGHFGEALNEHQMRRVARAAYHRSKTNV